MRIRRGPLLVLAFGIFVTVRVATAQGAVDSARARTGAVTSQASETPGTATPAFDVATIKPAAPSPDGHTHINYPPDGRFGASNVTLRILLAWAYDVPERQILDGPAWLDTTRFDLLAKSDSATEEKLQGMSGEEGRGLKRRMVQTLLADRYNLKAHRETRLLPAYDLLVAKGGPRLQPSQASGKSSGTGRDSFHGEGLTLALIADQLSQIIGRVVVDKTNLAGRYDPKLRWTPDNAPVVDNAAPSFFTAVQEQLGLRLEAAKEPVPVLVIDGVDLPSAN